MLRHELEQLSLLTGPVDGAAEHDGTTVAPPRLAHARQQLQRLQHEPQHAFGGLHDERTADVESLDAATAISIPNDARR